MTRLLRHLLLVVLVAGTLYAAPTATAAPVAAGAAAVPAAPPTVGSCHTLTARESGAATDPDPAVPCSTRHTSRTFAVPTVPAGIEMTDADALIVFAVDVCVPAYEKAVSRSARLRLLSAYSWRYFEPTAQEIEDGARWLRCDVVLNAGRSLAPLPRAKSPALTSTPIPDREARCYLGKNTDYLVTVCTQRHAARAAGTFRLSGATYPGQRRREAQARQQCPRIVGAGADWVAFFPSKFSFRTGFRFTVCAELTSR